MEENSAQVFQEKEPQVQQVQSSSNLPKPNIWKIFSLVIFFLVLSGGLVFAGLYIGKNLLPTNNQQTAVTPTIVLPQGEEIIPTGEPVEEVIDNDSQVKFFPKPIKVPSMGLMTTIIKANLLGMGPGTPDPTDFDYEGNSTYYKIGIMKVPEYKDKELYLLNIKNVPMSPGSTSEEILRFIKNGDKFVLLDKNSNLYIDDSQTPPPPGIVHEEIFIINSLVYEPQIVFTYQGKELMFEGWSNNFEVTAQMEKIGKIGKKDFYKEVKTVGTKPIFKEIGEERTFYLKYPDTTYTFYTLSSQYISAIPQTYWEETQKKKLSVPTDFQINWTDGLVLKSDKTYGDGTVRYNQYDSTMHIPVAEAGKITYYNKTIDLAGDLVLIGTNPAGEQFFGLKDKNHIIYKDFYAIRNDYSDFTKNMSYEDFMAQRPMFFWKDLFGDYHALFRGDFEIAAGIAKPAIYLYPEKEATISVQIDNTLKNLVTIPDYAGEWRVTASPSGLITYGGKTFDYLFYEGDKRGFVFKAGTADMVKRENVETYLEKKLFGLGLNVKERTQFKEYWVPRMQMENYYSVSFMGTEDLQREVPLEIMPKPATLIRILMKYAGMKKGVEKYSFASNPPVRAGFTAVEWGGLK